MLVKLESEFRIDIGRCTPGSARLRFSKISNVKEFQSQIAILYLGSLVEKISTGSSQTKLLNCYNTVATSILPNCHHKSHCLAIVCKRLRNWQISMALKLP